MQVKPGEEPTELKDKHQVLDEPAETPPTDDEFQNTEDNSWQNEYSIETSTTEKTKDTSTTENKKIGTYSSHEVKSNTTPQTPINISNEDLKKSMMMAIKSDEFKDAMSKAMINTATKLPNLRVNNLLFTYYYYY